MPPHKDSPDRQAILVFAVTARRDGQNLERSITVMEQETMIDLLRDSTHVNFDNADRIRMPTLVRGSPGFVEFRGMPWLKGIFVPQPKAPKIK